MSDKILTVSVAAYNVEDCLGRCLDCFASTDVFNELEIIVVNDGSKDGTASLAQSYVDRYPDVIRLIDKENGGHGSTINSSISAASGKYYKVVDADDWVDKEGFEKLVRFLENCDSDLVINPYNFIDASTMQTRDTRIPFNENVAFGVPLKLQVAARDIYMEMHALTYRTDILKKMGPVIDEHCFYVDIEYALLPMEFTETIVCQNWPVYQYLVGSADQSVSSANMVKRRSQHLRVFKRLVTYYEDKKDGLEPEIRRIILERLKAMAVTQYKIYFRTEKSLAKKEIREFDSWLKEASREVYEGTDCSAMKAVKILRKTDFSSYGPFIAVMNARWKMKGQSDII